MSSLLLLSAKGEGMASFVLPITDAFGPPKYVEHKFYFEIFQLTQFTIFIAALAYLQALMTCYNHKMQRCQQLCQGLTQSFAESSDKHIEEDEGGESGSDGSVETVPTSSPDYASPLIRTMDGSEELFHGSKPASAAELVYINEGTTGSLHQRLCVDAVVSTLINCLRQLRKYLVPNDRTVASVEA
ncbi:unnamed protein product [Taenia asiatica]|uniref:Pecanex-like protein n=1 Tax=Taenia asiatica TaxID=60517 RepID=A0A0R3WFT2_TAEAS|nr:unnamed protein product [Taenia asiatica]